MMVSNKTPGLYVAPPHGKLIATGEKTLIVRTVKEDLARVPIFILSKGDGKYYCYAKVYIGKPEEISLEEFNNLRPRHRISDAEFTEWGWKGKELFAYEVMVIEAYDPPIEVELPQDVQEGITDYKFIGTPPKEIRSATQFEETIGFDFISPEVLHAMSEDQLLELNEELHDAYQMEGFNKESVLNAYIFLVDECRRRNLEVPEFNDELEADAEKLGGLQTIESVVIGKLVPFVVTVQAVSLTGSAAYGLTRPRDYDWVVRHYERLPELEKELAERLPNHNHHFVYEPKGPGWKHIPVGDFILVPVSGKKSEPTHESVASVLKSLPKRIYIKDYLFCVKKDGRFTFRVDSNHRDDSLRLKLERIFQDPELDIRFTTEKTSGETCIGQLWLRVYDKLEVVNVDEPEFEDFYALKPLTETEAPKIADKVTKIEFGKWFPPIKVGSFGYAGKEVFNVDDNWKYWGQPMLDQHEFLIVQEKFDGIRMQFHVDKENGKVLIFTEGSLERGRQGLERSSYLPDLVEDCLKACKCDNCILDAEVVWWKGGRPLPRHQMVALSGGKEKISGEDIRVNVFDIAWLDGKQLNEIPYKKRLEILDEVIPEESKHIKKAESIIVKNKDEYYNAFQKLSSKEGSEGIMIKTPVMPVFSPTGRTSQMSKVKSLFEIDVVIIGRRKVPAAKEAGRRMTAEEMEKELPKLIKKSNTWTFRCAFLGKDGKLVPLESDKRYTPGDLELRWDEKRQKWVGTEDPKYWEMGLGFENRKHGDICYGNTYNFKAPDGVEPKIGDIITVAPILLRVWKEDDEYHVSWTFPRVKSLKPERDRPDDWKVVNNIVKAVSKRHGLESPEVLYEAEDTEMLAEVRPAFPSPGGKFFVAKRIASLIPPHKRYVEPFVGSGSVLLAKEKSEEEIIGDIDPDLIATWRFIKGMTEKEMEELRSYVWQPSRKRWELLKRWKPVKQLDRVYKFLYLRYHSWAAEPSLSYSPRSDGFDFENVLERMKSVKERIKDLKILRQDGVETIKQFDSPDTFFFIDPPFMTDYFPERTGLRRWTFPPERLLSVLKKLQGRFLLTLKDSAENRKLFAGFEQARIMTPFPTTRGKGHMYKGPTKLRALLLIANYPIHLSDRLAEVRQAFASPGGKRSIASKLIKIMPEHKTYVEPFAGGASVFFAKEPSEKEVLADINRHIIRAYRAIKKLTDADIETIRNKDWSMSKELWDKMASMKEPDDDVEFLYWFLYLRSYSYAGAVEKGFSSADPERDPDSVASILKSCRDRLQNTILRRQDFKETIKEFDSPDTLFYLDPPYPGSVGHEGKVQYFDCDPQEVLEAVKGIKGKFIITFPDDKEIKEMFADFHQRYIYYPLAVKSQSLDYGRPMKRVRSLVITNFKISEPISEAEMTHEQAREFAERVFGDPYMIKQSDTKTEFVVQYHLRGIWTEDERKELLRKLSDVKSQDELDELWNKSDCEYLLAPLSSWQKELQDADDERRDITQIMNKYLTRKVPKLGELDLSKVVNRGNAHTDLRIRHPVEDSLIGWTLTPPRIVIQYLETGNLEFPLRNRFLENMPGDKFPVVKKAVQPEVWFSLVTPRRPSFEASAGEVGATAETGGRFLYKTRGKLAFGVSKDDYHEYYLWFEEPYEHLSGRWGCQKLEGNVEYLKIPTEKGKPPQEWWMMNRPHKTQAPYILTHDRQEEEEKAKKEGIKWIIWNPELIDILLNDKLGKQWLLHGVKDGKREFILDKKNEFSKDGAEWKRRK